MGGWGWSRGLGLGLYLQSQRKAWASKELFSAGICSLWLRRTFHPSEFQPTSRRVRRQSHSLSLPLQEGQPVEQCRILPPHNCLCGAQRGPTLLEGCSPLRAHQRLAPGAR